MHCTAAPGICPRPAWSSSGRGNGRASSARTAKRSSPAPAAACCPTARAVFSSPRANISTATRTATPYPRACGTSTPDGAAADTGLTVQPQFSAEFAEGLAPLCVSTAEGWRYGYVNARGELAIPAAFDYAEDFRDGYAAARTLSGGMGLLRPDGSWALEPVYSELGYLWGDGAAFYALREGSVELIDRETLRVRAAFDVSHADYAYAYELDGAAIVIVAGGKCWPWTWRGTSFFPRRCGGGDRFRELYRPRGRARPPHFHARHVAGAGGLSCDLRLRRVAGPYRAIESGLW